VGLFSSSNNSISSNNIGKNGYGVGLDSFSDDNEILGNNITANYGHGIGLFASSNNTIFHNNLLDNSIQAYSTSDSTNSWDDGYPSGGNYWSDYNGTDLRMGPFQNQSGSDGVGDTPYFIDSQNYDNFPLIGFFSDFNISSHADIQTVSNSTISNLKLNSTEIRFNATGQPNTTGFCRISLPTDINISQFIVLINGKQVAYTQLPGFDINETFLFLTYSYPPEFSSLLILTLFLVCAFFTAIIYRKKIC
jgi:parallel beta-helix repeat protein